MISLFNVQPENRGSYIGFITYTLEFFFKMTEKVANCRFCACQTTFCTKFGQYLATLTTTLGHTGGGRAPPSLYHFGGMSLSVRPKKIKLFSTFVGNVLSTLCNVGTIEFLGKHIIKLTEEVTQKLMTVQFSVAFMDTCCSYNYKCINNMEETKLSYVLVFSRFSELKSENGRIALFIYCPGYSEDD